MKNKASQVDFLTRCSVCESHLDPVNTIVLDEGEQRTTMHISCAKCKSSVLVFISNGQAGTISVGVATDLDSSEVRGKFGRAVISADEIIDLHQFVYKEKGDLIRLIKNS